MTPIEALLYRMGQEQLANEVKPVDGFECGRDEVELVGELYRRGWIRLPRQQELIDGTFFHGVALTKAGVQEWTRLHRMHADPSKKQSP